jgi:hypothetical protein
MPDYFYTSIITGNTTPKYKSFGFNYGARSGKIGLGFAI